MNDLLKIDEDKLSEVLNKWFIDNNNQIILNKNFWERNKVGKVIKKQLKSCGKWKYRARGNPRKGYEKALKANW